MTSIRKIIILAFAAALAVVGVVYFVNRPKPPPPRQTVKSLHELGILPKGYDGWLAHVEAELLAEGEERPPDLRYPGDPPIVIDIGIRGDLFLNATSMTKESLVSILKRALDGQPEISSIVFRAALDAPMAAIEPVARAIVDAGFGSHLSPTTEGGEALGDFSRVYSIKLGGRFIRL